MVDADCSWIVVKQNCFDSDSSYHIDQAQKMLREMNSYSWMVSTKDSFHWVHNSCFAAADASVAAGYSAGAVVVAQHLHVPETKFDFVAMG